MFKGYRQTLLNSEPTFRPLRLFANGEQGVWYDPSDFSTMFQDSAGTTPVTAIEQPVGLILDKSGRGNHATQSTTTSRPILRNLYNLLQYTEQFNDATWAKASGLPIISNNATTAPDGTLTADKIVNGTVPSGTHGISQTITVSAAQYTFSVYAKTAGESRYLGLAGLGLAGSGEMPVFNLDAGTVDIPATTTIFKSASITSVGGGWYLCSVTLLPASGSTAAFLTVCANATDNTTTNYTYTGNNTGFFIWGASLVPANEASIPYQRVVTNTLGSGVYNTDLTKFPVYLRSDRTDDSYTTADGGGGTTGFFYCASIILQTAGQTHTLISDTGTNTGYRVRINSSNQVELSAGNGSAYTTATTTETLSTGQIAVITAWHDGTKLYAQINNGTIAEQAFGTATAGTAALTIGKDNGAASSYFGGGIYYYVYRKDKAPTDVDRAKTKALCAAKGGITL